MHSRIGFSGSKSDRNRCESLLFRSKVQKARILNSLRNFEYRTGYRADVDVDVEHNTTPVFSFVCARILYDSVRISLSVCRKSFSLLQLVVQVFGVYT